MVVLGRLVAPYGVRGWLRIHAFGDDPESWRSMPQWWLCADAGADASHWRPVKLEACKVHGDGIVVKLEGIDDRDAAEAADGLFIGAPRDALPRPAPDEYYWADLIGLDVVNMQDEPLGKVERLIETGANAVFVVRDGETERLLPFVGQVVKKVDLAMRIIRVEWGTDW